jgi:hypothetical protein
MASSFDSFNPEGYQNDPTKQHVQHDYDDGYIGDGTLIPWGNTIGSRKFLQ